MLLHRLNLFRGVSNEMKLLPSVFLPFVLNPSTRRSGLSRPSHIKSLRRMATKPANNDNVLADNRDNSNEKTIIHFNHAGASPSPQSVLDTIVEHLQLEQRVGGYTAAQMASGKLHNVYGHVAALLHVNSAGKDPTTEIALVESATVAWTRLFYSMIQYQHKKRRQNCDKNSRKSVILVSEAEYAANVVAACQWAKEHSSSWTVLSIPSTKDVQGQSTGIVNLEALRDMLQGQYTYSGTTKDDTSSDDILLNPADIAMVCITHVPTNSGICNPVEQIGKQIDDFNKAQRTPEDGDEAMPSILYLVDACQSVGQMDVHADQLHCHGLVATGRKFLRGPRGTGFLYVPQMIANQLIPSHSDHFGVPVTAVPSSDANSKSIYPVEALVHVQPKEGAARFEYYESSIANKLGLGEAIRYAMHDVGMTKIEHTCRNLAIHLYERLKAMKGVKVYHKPGCGIVTFYVPLIPSETVKEKLYNGSPKFETSLVPATSTPLDSSQTRAPNMVRVSLTYTNTAGHIDSLCENLSCILNEKE